MSTPTSAAAELNHKQLREAAERILTNKHYNYWECNWAQNAMTDGALLAHAYLALALAAYKSGMSLTDWMIAQCDAALSKSTARKLPPRRTRGERGEK